MKSNPGALIRILAETLGHVDQDLHAGVLERTRRIAELCTSLDDRM